MASVTDGIWDESSLKLDKQFINPNPSLLTFQNFQEQSIDGTGLPLLTEKHLRNLLSMKLGPALKMMAILSSRMGVQCQKCGGQNAALPANSNVSPSPSPSSVNGSESRRMSQGAAATGANNRRSESPQAKLPMSNDSFASFRTKLESMSPNYSSGGEATGCENMIATVTMTTAPGGRSTPKDMLSRDEVSPNGKDIPMISAADH